MSAIADKIHHLAYALALTIVGTAVVFVWGYVELHRPENHATPNTVASKVDSLEREVQGVVQATQVLAASRGSVPAFASPAVTVLRDMPGGNTFTPAQWAQILAGLKTPTREVIGAKVVGPKPTAVPSAPPGWTAAQTQAIYEADIAATEKVLADPQTHIAVSVTREEVQPTRVGSIFTPDGSGLDVAVFRRGHLEANIGAIARGSHLSPVLEQAWLIPHTAVSFGPYISYDKHWLYGLSATVHF